LAVAAETTQALEQTVLGTVAAVAAVAVLLAETDQAGSSSLRNLCNETLGLN
jgi:hypothetical protein